MSKLVAALAMLTVSGIATATQCLVAWPPCKSTPEIDPSSALTAVSLLLGGLAVLRGRIGKK